MIGDVAPLPRESLTFKQPPLLPCKRMNLMAISTDLPGTSASAVSAELTNMGSGTIRVACSKYDDGDAWWRVSRLMEPIA